MLDGKYLINRILNELYTWLIPFDKLFDKLYLRSSFWAATDDEQA